MSESVRFHKFPLDGIEAMSAVTLRSFVRHTHDQYGIGVIDIGGHASTSDRGQVEAGAGSLIFVNPGEVHDGRAIGGRSRAWRMLYFEPVVFAAARADILDGAGPSARFAAPVLADEFLRRLFDATFKHANATSESRSPIGCESTLLQLVAGMEVNATSAPKHATKSTARIRRARDRIDADPAAPLTLADLAQEVGISRYQLLRAFARELGLTPHAYILQRRIALARRLILSGVGLAPAATAAGFCDQSHFTRSFVRQFGITPARYVLNAE